MTDKIVLNVTPSFLKALMEADTTLSINDALHILESKSTEGEPLTHTDVKELLHGNLIQKADDAPLPVDPNADTQPKAIPPDASEEAARQAIQQSVNEEMARIDPGFAGKTPAEGFVGLEQSLSALKWAADKGMDLSLSNVIWLLSRVQNNKYADIRELQRDLVRMAPPTFSPDQDTKTEIYYSSIPGFEQPWSEPPLSSKEEPAPAFQEETTKTKVSVPPLSQ